MIKAIDSQPWLDDLKRRVQHYGYKYDYKERAVKPDSYLGPLPDWLEPVTRRLPFKPDQAIVNEYEPGQGISAHIDCVPCFGAMIASLSLGSGAVMQFTNRNEKHEIYLEPRSLIVLSGEARFRWTHAIPAQNQTSSTALKLRADGVSP